MDPWINSLVQSPLVRSLNSVPGRMSSFAHGMKDNVPPVSFQKVVVQPYQTDSTRPSATHRFRVPQYGLLDRAYCRIRLNAKYNPNMVRDASTNKDDTQRPAWTSCKYETSCASSSWNYADALVSVSLQTNNKVIETIPAECIAAEVIKMPEAQRKFFEKGMCGYAAGGGNGVIEYQDAVANTLYPVNVSATNQTQDKASTNTPFSAPANAPSITSSGTVLRRYQSLWDPSAKSRELTSYADHWDVHYVEGLNNHADFIIPLPFSCLSQLKNNYQTRFVEALEIHVQTKDYKHGIQSRTSSSTLTGNDYYDVELVLLYHNFHDTIENTIRDSNFKRGFPASVYAHDWVEETVLVTGNRATVEFRSNNLVSEIIMVRQHKQDDTYVYGSTYNVGKADLSSATGDSGHNMLAPRKGKALRITLSGSGRELWSGSELDLIGPDVADYELTDGHPYGSDLAQDGLACHDMRRDDSVVPARVDSTATDYPQAKLGGVYLGFDRNLLSMRLGFQSNNHFYTGGLAFQTLSNPTLTIETADGQSFGNQTFRVYVKYNTLQRINSDTGVITRTLDV